MKLLETLRAIHREDPDALLTKVMMWKVSDLIAAIETGNSGFGFSWSFTGDDYVAKSAGGQNYHVLKLNPDGGDDVIFWTPSAKQLGIVGGMKRTEAKKSAAIENGRKGGRPHYFVQLYNAMNSAIETTKTEFPVLLLPAESTGAFSISCSDFVWQIRWDVINRNVIAFHNGLVAHSYNTTNNSAQGLARRLVEEINRDKLMSKPEKFGIKLGL